MDKCSESSANPDVVAKRDLDTPALFWEAVRDAKEANIPMVDFYSEWGVFYDHAIHADEAFIEIQRRVAVELADAIGTTDVSVIDIACGTGRTGDDLKHVGFTQIDGVDGSPCMLKLAEEKNIYRNLYEGLVTSTGMRHIVEDSCYDGATCVAGVTYLAIQVADFLDEVHRILKPGGIAIYTVFEPQNPQVYPTGSQSFMEEHGRRMRGGKIDIISMLRVPYYNFNGTVMSCYLLKTQIIKDN